LQIEKFLARHETLVAERGEAAVRVAWSEEERAIGDEFIAHARAIRAEREAAAARSARPTSPAVNGWGGVHHRLSPAPDRFAVLHAEPRGGAQGAGGGHPLRRGLSPWPSRSRQRPLHSGSSRGQQGGREDRRDLAARTILVAAGRSPTPCWHARIPTHAFIDGKYFRAIDEAASGDAEAIRQARRGARADA